MSAHRTLNDLFRAFDAIGPGHLDDPGDAGTITVEQWGQICSVVTAAAETRTLAQPTRTGLQCSIELDVYVGAMTLTVTGGYNQSADTAIIFGTAGDWVTFVSRKVGSSYYWRVAAQEGTDATLTGGGTDETRTVEDLTVGSLKLTVTTLALGTGTLQSTAVGAFLPGVNIITAIGSVDHAGGLLPVGEAGMVVVVKNDSASNADVFCNGVGTGCIINALATTTAYPLATKLSAAFIAEDATQWHTLPLLAS